MVIVMELQVFMFLLIGLGSSKLVVRVFICLQSFNRFWNGLSFAVCVFMTCDPLSIHKSRPFACRLLLRSEYPVLIDIHILSTFLHFYVPVDNVKDDICDISFLFH